MREGAERRLHDRYRQSSVGRILVLAALALAGAALLARRFGWLSRLPGAVG